MPASTRSVAEQVRARHITTGVTLVVLVAILVVGAVLGVKSLFAPVKGATADPSPTCTPEPVRKGQRILPGQVQVSVFNASTRTGLADQTMTALTDRGFRKGAVGNAPPGIDVKRAQVWTTQRNDASARLVARQFGKSTIVQVRHGNLGPGIDVVVGSHFAKLAKAPRVIVARHPSSRCVPVSTASPTG